jgi:TolB-like protein/DNA-binding winged helix-turn-helix (wHTH) protein/Tfp pilus assembly protein PilF
MDGGGNGRLRFGDFEFDSLSGKLFREDRRVKIQPQPLRVLGVLLERAGEIVPREQLRTRVWGDATFVEFDQGLNYCIRQIRLVLHDGASHPLYVETLPKQGYRFIARVTVVPGASKQDGASQAGPTPAAINQIVTEATDPINVELPRDTYVPVFNLREAPTPVARRKWHFTAAWSGPLAVAALSLLFAFEYAPKSPPPRPERSIAVLPFLDLSPEKDQEYFCDGMTEELISELATIDGLRVVARTSVFAFKGRPQDVRQVGKQLNVATVLEGSIRKAGDHLRITAQLISVPDGYHLWSESYDRELKELFAVQKELARSIAGTLEVSLSALPTGGRDTSNLEAYDSYLLGRFHWSKRSEPELDTAVRDFEAAVRLDPTYARAYAGLADAYLQLGRWASRDPRETMPKARQYALKSLELNDSLAEARTSLGAIHLFYDWDLAAAQREYEKAIAINPGYVTAHWWYAFLLLASGQLPVAHREMKLALRIDPLSVPMLADAANLYRETGDQSGALAAARKALELDPTSTIARVNLGLALADQNRLPDALASFAEAAAADPENALALEFLATGSASLGQSLDAEKAISRLLALSKSKYVACEIAAAYASAGHSDQALTWLERAITERSTCIPWLRTGHFGGVLNPFRDLKGNRQYQAILAKAVSNQ